MNDKKERSLFNLISEKSKESLMNAGNVVTLKKGEVLFSEREDVKSMYIVLDGYMSLYRNSRYGEIKIIFICTNGEVINEVVLQDEKTSICAKALKDTKLLVIHRSELFKLLEQDHELTMQLYESLARKTRRLYHQVGNANGTYPLEKRLAAKIWKLARDYGENNASGKTICFETTVTFLANMLGAKRETVSRLVSQLKKEGIISHESGFLTVLDMARLKEVAQ
ncbi:MAG: Crp/Fnr family transcriptional regulator [Pseudobutyrivibrio sp.]|nr:Crp/Fnr family transcriptional regulator [Pseudobutyrivibrio sp.]